MVITAHPKDGVELAKEYGLPPIIHNFILQHHGEGLASYFYKIEQLILKDLVSNKKKLDKIFSKKKDELNKSFTQFRDSVKNIADLQLKATDSNKGTSIKMELTSNYLVNN